VHQTALFRAHGRPLMRAILFGFAGVAPRSVVPNLIEILSTLLSRATATVGDVGLEGGAVQWMKDVLMAVCDLFFFFFFFRFSFFRFGKPERGGWLLMWVFVLTGRFLSQ
jgi:hypothetical protein